MSQPEQPWLKAEEVTQDGIYWMRHMGDSESYMAKVRFSEETGKFCFKGFGGRWWFGVRNDSIFHGPLTPPPAP